MSGNYHKNSLLVEIGMEELPTKSLQGLENDFIAGMSKQLQNYQFSFDAIQGFVTPRRLALLITGLSHKQATRMVVKRGPAKQAGLDAAGNPSKALEGFAKSCGVQIQDLKLQETEKGSWYIFEVEEKGQEVKDIFAKILNEVIHNLPLPKRMNLSEPMDHFLSRTSYITDKQTTETKPELNQKHITLQEQLRFIYDKWDTFKFKEIQWGDSVHESFIRPVHWLVILYGNDIIAGELFGIKSSNETRGHRFHHPEKITLNAPEDYENSLLETGMVRANFIKRKNYIAEQIKQFADEHHAFVEPDDALLIENTGLVEWPVILVGNFDPNFLTVPKEALISAMKTHQKCFPLQSNDLEKALLSKFIIISNINSNDPKVVIKGNEAVIHARLSDALFHYNQDKKYRLEHRLENLKQVVFQKGLGTLFDKSQRISQLASSIAKKIGADPNIAERAALLAKTDLLTNMVQEFPELQGIMGRYYAYNDGEKPGIGEAIEAHYLPRFANDNVPLTLEGCSVALADRIDSLVGIFGLGIRASGEKDPYGLRRLALGIIRILIENELMLDLKDLFLEAQELYGEEKRLTTSPLEPLLTFCFERLRAAYHEQNIPTSVFEAVLAKYPTKPLDFEFRIRAVTEFLSLPEAESLVAANKRVSNILNKNESSISKEVDFDEKLLVEPAEKELVVKLLEKEKEIHHLLKNSLSTATLETATHELDENEPQNKLAKIMAIKTNYRDILRSLASLKTPIDTFFDKVMVMVEEEKLRNNRIKLLKRLRMLFLEVADISLL